MSFLCHRCGEALPDDMAFFVSEDGTVLDPATVFSAPRWVEGTRVLCEACFKKETGK